MSPISKDSERYRAAKLLLNAALKFWQACEKEGQHGAVQWLAGTNGELLIFTRGEYRDGLMNNIWTLSQREQIGTFAEELPSEDECGPSANHDAPASDAARGGTGARTASAASGK